MKMESENNTSHKSVEAERNRSYHFPDTRLLVRKNHEVDYRILLALYHHRSLTVRQLYQIADCQVKENSVRNRLRTLAQRKLLSSNSRNGIARVPVTFYSLTNLGLRIVVEDILQVEEYVPDLDDFKYHYTLDDLRFRGNYSHHYALQEWLADVKGKLTQYYPHCEWRRYPLLEDEDNVGYRPDWLFFQQNETINRLLEESPYDNPLYIPYLARKELYNQLELHPLMSVECDRGTMSRTELLDKWERLKGYDTLPVSNMVVYYPNESNNTTRHINIRGTLFHSFEEELIQDKFTVFEGTPESTAKVVSAYLNRNLHLVAGEAYSDYNELLRLVRNANDHYAIGKIALASQEMSWKEELQLPVEVDRVILKETQSTSEIQFVYFCYESWVNPIAKARVLNKWLQEGNLTLFDKASVILMYPDHDSLARDVHLKDSELYYVAYDEITDEQKWGKAYQRNMKYRKVVWEECQL
ncbi:hypothetical protein GLW08_20510 [Pontibacillus yanchengensis]|uniref:Uncharacterized protein n=3 Tax=Pontibacillus yanchengensis TaxID=462910 RepID=A0ACC7VL26_9BACI|nr:hypothetical protein [Pontibacillus yanchengensis]MYL55688.1 hypothetical protein [Pontibacillus yanchengensis]